MYESNRQLSRSLINLRRHLLTLNGNIKHLSRNGHHFILSYWFIHYFNSYRILHVTIYKWQTFLNESLISSLTWTSFCSYFILNVYFITLLTIYVFTLEESLFLILLIVVQLTLFFVTINMLSNLSNSLYQCKPLFFNLNALTSIVKDDQRLELRTRIKMMNFLEQLNNRKRFYFSIGSVRYVSRKSLVEFIYIYFAYLLYSFNMIYNNRNKV